MRAVAAVKCSAYGPEELRMRTAEAIKLAGGLPEKVKPGAKILIKPNLLTALSPEMAATTHPEVVRALIRCLRAKGIDNITVGDSPAGGHSWEKLWTETGFLEMTKQEGVPLLPFENIKRVECEGVGVLPLLRELDDFDAVISVPKLKTHALTKVTGAVKNSYGLMVGHAKSNFHGDFPSPRQMARFLVKFYSFVKPDFVLMDSIVCMEGEGPAGGNPKHIGILFAGCDAVAVDACACRIFGYAPRDITMLVEAEKAGFGIASPDKISLKGDAVELLDKTLAARSSKVDMLHAFPEPVFKIASLFLACRPHIDPALCKKCGMCEKICSQKAIRQRKGIFKVKKSDCILCMCCLESCPYHAISLVSPGMKIKRIIKKLMGKD